MDVRVATAAGTADALDFLPVDTVVTVPAGSTRATVSVDVLPDDVAEDVETFEVHVVAVTRARVGDGVAAVTIEPAAAPPQPPVPSTG